MQFRTGQVLDLVDSRQQLLGTVKVDRTDGTLVCGQFRIAAGFAAVAELFRRFDEAVDAQALAVVDELDRDIAALGLQLRAPETAANHGVHDVQIYADGSFSCRLTTSVPANGANTPAASRTTA